MDLGERYASRRFKAYLKQPAHPPEIRAGQPGSVFRLPALYINQKNAQQTIPIAI